MKNSKKIHSYLIETVGKHNSPAVQPLERCRFRGSQLPVCPIQWVLTDVILDTAETSIYVDSGYPYSNYFLQEGTLVHALLQTYLGSSKILYGKFKCSLCKRVTEDQLGSELCCGRWMTYQEFEFNHSSGFSCHIDAFIYLFNLHILGDFKTSKSAWSKDYKIPNNYYEQLNSYFWVCKEKGYNFDIPALIYVPRDYFCLNPRNWIIKEIKPNKDKWLLNITNVKRAKKCKNFKDFKPIVKECICETGDDCMFKPVCHPKAGMSRMDHFREIFGDWSR